MIHPTPRSVREDLRVIAFADQVEDAARASASAYLARVATQVREDGLSVATHVRIGDTVEAVRAVLVAGPRCRRSA